MNKKAIRPIVVNDDHDKVSLSIGDKIVHLHFRPFDTDVDVDDLTIIHHENLMGEVLTMPVLMNRIGLLKAEASNNVREVKLELDIEEARLGDHYRRALKIPSGEKIKYPSVDQVKDAVKLDPAYQNTAKKYSRVQKELEYIEALYWALKSKDDKINKLSDRIKPEEFEKEIVEGVINTINIRTFGKLIK